MKKLLSVMLVMVMVVALFSACGKKTTVDDDPNKGNNQEDQTGQENEDKKITLKFWHAWQGDEADKLQVYIDKYMQENPNITIETLSGTTTEKQMLALSGGDTFDVGYNMDYRIPLWGREGMLLSLNSLIEGSGYNKDDILDSELALMTIKDEIYGVPFTVDTYQLYYNKDILEEIGLDAPPATWPELYDAALMAVKMDDNGDYTRLGFLNNFPWKNEQVFHILNDAHYVDVENNVLTINAPENIEAMKFKASFHGGPDYDTQKIIKFQSGFGQYASAENAFLKGQLAFSLDGEWFPTFVEMYNPDLNYGIASIPYNPNKPELKERGLVAGGALYIPKACSQPEAAFDFIKYLTEEAQVPFCIDKGSLPSLKSGLENPELVEKAPDLKPFIDLALAGKLETMPQIEFLTELMKEISDAEDKIYDGTATVEEAFDEAQESVQKVMDKLK